MHSHNSEDAKPTDSCAIWHTLSLNKIQGFFDKEFDWFYFNDSIMKMFCGKHGVYVTIVTSLCSENSHTL